MVNLQITRNDLTIVCVWAFLLQSCKSETDTNVTERASIYQDEWVVRVEGGPQVASLLALRSGYINLGLVLGFRDTYLWHKDDRSRQRKRGNLRYAKALTSYTEIVWVDQQRVFQRHKRDYVTASMVDSEIPLVREKRLLGDMKSSPKLSIAQRHRKSSPRTTREPDISTMFNDELWNEEWYLDPEISYDVNERDDDPIPRYEPTGTNGHGTRCAGEIAMEANNRKCGVGVAFEAAIGGIKLLDGIVNDRVEGEALGYKQNLVDIYTASWGPADDGKSLEAPGRLATEALDRGIAEGRGGKGNIYVWASGNGGSQHDDCGCDGYVGSIYTIAVGSASQTGKFPWYGERCSATLATTYSSGAYHDQMIATTDLKNKCTTHHTGTSASAPLAAGIFALALQVNKELTWRDVQHLVVHTSEYSPLRHNPGWFRNSAGFWFNPRFGFGLMNAHALVTAAQNWTTVPEKSVCVVESSSIWDKTLRYGETTTVSFDVDGCVFGDEVKVSFLEHVQIETSIKYTLRGALEMRLTSPAGTEIQILNPRKLDDSSEGFSKWKFMSVGNWGEDPRGTWILEISDQMGPDTNSGTIENLTLILHGTYETPNYRKNGPRMYNDEYNRIRKTNHLDETMSNEDRVDELRTMDVNEVNYSTKDRELNEIIGIDWLARFLRV